MTLALKNSSRYVGRKGDTHWWDWTAFLEGTEDALKEVKYVEYHLHPGFSDPIRRVSKRQGGFALTTRGWGTFELVAKVVFKEPSKRKRLLRHYLDFEDSEDL